MVEFASSSSDDVAYLLVCDEDYREHLYFLLLHTASEKLITPERYLNRDVFCNQSLVFNNLQPDTNYTLIINYGDDDEEVEGEGEEGEEVEGEGEEGEEVEGEGEEGEEEMEEEQEGEEMNCRSATTFRTKSRNSSGILSGIGGSVYIVGGWMNGWDHEWVMWVLSEWIDVGG